MKELFLRILAITVLLGLFMPLANAGASGFIATTSMNTPRMSHTATLLPTGKVLITGGYNYDDSYLNNAELYDPASGTWSATNSMTTVRVRHTAALLADGRVLVAGGQDNAVYLSSVELYDPASGTWSVTRSDRFGRTCASGSAASSSAQGRRRS